MHQATWGFTIFRTVYTPESDAQFVLFLARLRTYVDYSIDLDLQPTPFMPPSTEPPFDNGPNEEMKRKLLLAEKLQFEKFHPQLISRNCTVLASMYMFHCDSH